MMPLHPAAMSCQPPMSRQTTAANARLAPMIFKTMLAVLFIMFLLSRYVGREAVRRYVERKLSPRWRARLERAGGREGFVLLVILRLIPAVPYNLINYTFGLTSMSLGTYLAASAIGIIPGTVVFINIGDKALDPASPGFWLALGLLALLLAGTAWLGRRLFPAGEDNKKGERKA